MTGDPLPMADHTAYHAAAHRQHDGSGPDQAWSVYATALGTLHTARRDAFATFQAASRAEAERAAALERLRTELDAQRTAIEDLATRLRAPAGSISLAPSEVAPADGVTGLADLRTRTADVAQALDTARHVATLPQLLPDWRSQFARAAVVYSAFCVPNLLLALTICLAEFLPGRESIAVFLFFAVIWPLVTAFGGGAVVRHVTRARAGEDPFPPEESAGARPSPGRKAGSPLTGSGLSEPLYRWLGLLVAWASWLIPTGLLVWLFSLSPI
jgi:hypothetical protein